MQNRRMTTLVYKGVFLATLIILMVLYSLYQAKNLLGGPQILISSPPEGSKLEASLTHIEGKAKNVSAIYLNDRTIYIDPEGNFKEKLIASRGYNVYTLKARDKFGRETEKKLELIY